MLINSVSGMSQYKIGDRIVTIFGEYHDDTSLCRGVNISVSEWCEHRVRLNPKTYVLLEYNDNMEIKDRSEYGSAAVRYAFSRKGKIPLLRDRVIGVDLRLDYLQMKEQQELYHGSRGFNPKFARIYGTRKGPGPVLDHSVCGEYEKKLDTYIKIVDEFFGEYGESGNLLLLQWAWSFLMDYRILWEITRTDVDSNEMIAVIGENHRSNIKDILRIWNVDNIKEVERCVDVNEIITPR